MTTENKQELSVLTDLPVEQYFSYYITIHSADDTKDKYAEMCQEILDVGDSQLAAALALFYMTGPATVRLEDHELENGDLTKDSLEIINVSVANFKYTIEKKLA